MSSSNYIEQAVYTSARTSRGAGYHLIAISPGVSEADQRVLPSWCPSHEGLLPDIPERRSVNFFALPSGAYCVARSVADGEDYSLRGAARVVTNLLLVPIDVLARFGNDPFALLRAVELSGRLPEVSELDSVHLTPIPLVGRAGPVNEPLLTGLLREIGPARVGIALETLLTRRPLAMGGITSPEKLIAGLWQCLPVECRTAFSFATGLQYSPRRPFDLVALPEEKAARRRLKQRYQVETMDLGELDTARVAPQGWANHVATTLACGGPALLAAQLEASRPELSLRDLPALAAELANFECDSEECGSKSGRDVTERVEMRVAHAHGAHRRHQQPVNAAQVTLTSGSLSLNVSNGLMERLETLDDTVFDAIAGKPGALEQLESLWPEIVQELPRALVEESQEHFMAHAMRCWEHFTTEGRSPEKAVAALDVLTLLCERKC